MDVQVLHPITHDGTHYSRGRYPDMDEALGTVLIGIHSPQCTRDECHNHSAIEFVEKAPAMGKATPAADADTKNKKADPLKQPPPEAGVKDTPAPDASGPGKA